MVKFLAAALVLSLGVSTAAMAAPLPNPIAAAERALAKPMPADLQAYYNGTGANPEFVAR